MEGTSAIKRRECEIKKEKTYNLMEKCLRDKLKSNDGPKFKQSANYNRSNPRSRQSKEMGNVDLADTKFSLTVFQPAVRH